MSRRNVGVWRGPGVLMLIDGEWRWVDVANMPRHLARELKERATAIVGRDEPTISVLRIVDPAEAP